MTRQADGIAVDSLSVRTDYLDSDACGLALGTIGEFHRCTDVFVVASGDVEGMAAKIQILRCGDDSDIAEQTAAGVPA